MSVNLVLPPLSLWAADHLKRLLESKTKKDFDTIFDETFAAHCAITLNEKAIHRDEYKAQLLAQSAAGFGGGHAVVNIVGQTQVEVGNQGQLSGLVGLFYTAVDDSRFLIHDTPTQRNETSSVNLVIKPTEKDPRPPTSHIHGYFDPRRVTSVNQVTAETTYRATFSHTTISKLTAGQTSAEKA